MYAAVGNGIKNIGSDQAFELPGYDQERLCDQGK